MIINDKKEDLRRKNYHCHKSLSDRNALAMMCQRNEES